MRTSTMTAKTTVYLTEYGWQYSKEASEKWTRSEM